MNTCSLTPTPRARGVVAGQKTKAEPGWYPCPTGWPGILRYFDGDQWTGYWYAMSQPVGVVASPPTDHLLHLVLTILTCGMWLPVWMFLAIFGSRKVSVIDNRGQIVAQRSYW